jgi:hypothetical protein
MLPNNVHAAERAVRVVLGIIGLALVFTGPETAWGWLGLLPLLTGLAGSCPLYTALGFSTRKPAPAR